jgi:hypothetical protein
MLPGEREMVKRLADRPFTLLGINSDESRSALQASIERAKITWPNIYEGKPREISKRWNVRFFPETYVLDQNGVIRLRGLGFRGEALEDCVTDLLAKAKKE